MAFVDLIKSRLRCNERKECLEWKRLAHFEAFQSILGLGALDFLVRTEKGDLQGGATVRISKPQVQVHRASCPSLAGFPFSLFVLSLFPPLSSLIRFLLQSTMWLPLTSTWRFST